MSNDPNDYRLPPFPKDYQGLSRDWLDYGHACAEHVRVPLLARIAELESLLSGVVSDTAEELGCAADNESILLAAGQLRDELAAKAGEVEKYKADAERYRTWRHAFREGECDFYNAICNAESEAEHDAAIDAAIAARKGASREADEGAAQAKEGAE